MEARFRSGYVPRYPEVHRTLERKRFCVIVAHRRFGKTVLAINHVIKMAFLQTKPLGRYAFVAPLLNQAKRNTWDYFKQYTARIPGRTINEAEHSIRLPNGALIQLFGADNPDALRGPYLDGVVLDEVAQMKPGIWEEVVRPMLADRPGWALFIGTPKGVNLFSSLYHQAMKLQAENHAEWAAFSFPVTATNALPEAEVENLRHTMSDNLFRQEMLCDFNAANDDTLIPLAQVDESLGRKPDYDIARHYPLVVGVDVARFGDDATVFCRRQGKVAFAPLVLSGYSNTEVAHRLLAYIAEHRPAEVNIDQGQGTGVIDLLRDLAFRRKVIINEIPFGSRACNPEKYVNRRAEMWVSLRDWLKGGGVLPNDQKSANALRLELCAPMYSFDAKGRIKLEPKEYVKERIGKSPDVGDALALTFATDPMPDSASVFPEFESRYERDGGARLRDYVLGKREKKEWRPW